MGFVVSWLDSGYVSLKSWNVELKCDWILLKLISLYFNEVLYAMSFIKARSIWALINIYDTYWPDWLEESLASDTSSDVIYEI